MLKHLLNNSASSARDIAWMSDQSLHSTKWMPALEQVTVQHLDKCPLQQCIQYTLSKITANADSPLSHLCDGLMDCQNGRRPLIGNYKTTLKKACFSMLLLKIPFKKQQINEHEWSTQV